MASYASSPPCCHRQRPIGCLKLQVIFGKRATNDRALLAEHDSQRWGILRQIVTRNDCRADFWECLTDHSHEMTVELTFEWWSLGLKSLLDSSTAICTKSQRDDSLYHDDPLVSKVSSTVTNGSSRWLFVQMAVEVWRYRNSCQTEYRLFYSLLLQKRPIILPEKYEVATVSRLSKNIGLFCKRTL